jgi:hypothetical protein
MKLHSVQLARTVWLFDLADFNPKGLNLWPVCEWLTTKYGFSGYPKNLLDLSPEKTLAFRFGSFVNSSGENVLVSLTIFNNGLAAEASSSTNDSDEFLQQAAGEISKEFGLVVPPSVGRAHVSQVEVESPHFSLAGLNPELVKFAKMLSRTVATTDGKPRDFDFGVFQLWTADTNPATSPAYFRFERKIGLPPSSNRYFSQAALKTQEHLAFLEAFENAFKTQHPTS